jgi:hypothetical protein
MTDRPAEDVVAALTRALNSVYDTGGYSADDARGILAALPDHVLVRREAIEQAAWHIGEGYKRLLALARQAFGETDG